MLSQSKIAVVGKNFRYLIFLLGLAGLCTGLILLVYKWRQSRGEDFERVARNLPVEQGIVLFVDVGLLRKAGAFDTPWFKSLEQEAEYQDFVTRTDLDPRTDIDKLLACFTPDSNFFFVAGRFPWDKLEQYVVQSGGRCHNTFCQIEGTRPDRQISFFPYTTHVMALAVSENAWAADLLKSEKYHRLPFVFPSHPVWVRIPPAFFDGRLEVAGERFRWLRQALTGAQELIAGVQASIPELKVFVEVHFQNEQFAQEFKSKLDFLSLLAGKLLPKGNSQVQSDALLKAIESAQVETQGNVVTARWPLKPELLEKLGQSSP